MTKRKPLPQIAQCDAIGCVSVVSIFDPHACKRRYVVSARRGRRGDATWMMGRSYGTERAAILAWNAWIAKIRFGEWRPA